MLMLTAPIQAKSFLDYTFRVVFEEWLGLDYRADFQVCDQIIISLRDRAESIELPVGFLLELSRNKSENIDFGDIDVASLRIALVKLDLDSLPAFRDKEGLPVIFGSPDVQVNDDIQIQFDLFGTIFFMLSRVEELASSERDQHNRFPAKASLAYKLGFLDRPIVDEYVELLWACMSRLWPELKRKEHTPKMFISSDVDTPFDPTVKSLPRLLRTCAGDLVKRKSVPEAIKRMKRYYCNKRGDFRFDPNYTFDWYMDVCERNGFKAAFYFIPSSLEPGNGDYSLADPAIKELLIKIDERGHEIGVHGSYQTFRDGEKLKQQKALLDKALLDLGIKQEVKGNRQHYLRWDSSITPDLLDEAGLEYDTTGGYADHAGFRYGTSHEFSMWSWQKKKKLNIKQRPLIVMECSVLDEAYMGLGATEEALKYMNRTKSACAKVSGNFSLLWHNSSLSAPGYRALLEMLLTRHFTVAD